jgi:hypothetical protein
MLAQVTLAVASDITLQVYVAICTINVAGPCYSYIVDVCSFGNKEIKQNSQAFAVVGCVNCA